MGNTVRKETVMLEEERAMPFSLAVDLCEDIHLHYRDLRIDFSLKEWAVFVKFIIEMNQWIQTDHPDYNMTDPKYFAKNGLRIPTKSDFFPGRFQVEVQGPPYEGIVHIHYNDLRLEVPISVYEKILETMNRLNYK